MTHRSFISLTQYSHEFSKFIPNNNINKNFCSIFSLITANNYLSGKQINKQIHEENIIQAIQTHVLFDLNNQMYFTELINLTNLLINDITATSIELITLNILGYDQIFTKNKNKYAVIFLKNGKYFVVLVDNDIYHLRDCHESVQYNSFTRSEIIEHLNNVYQFDHMIDIDGYTVEEYSNIEYIVIYEQFLTNF